MFTGIIEGTGRIEDVRPAKNRSAVRITVSLGENARGLKIGQSVALNGVCLTVVKKSQDRCSFEMIDETIQKTDLGGLRRGGTVNVERSLRAGDRLEGHFVLGHIDGTALIKRVQKKPGEVGVWLEIPGPLLGHVVKKGSIAVDGISLTVADIKKNLALVCLIPHTLEVTSLGGKDAGDRVNIETDILGKYAMKR